MADHDAVDGNEDGAEEHAHTHDGEGHGRSAEIATFWADAGIDPVEIALPGDVGLTLRHYRTVTVEVDDPDDGDDGDPDADAETDDADDDADDRPAKKSAKKEPATTEEEDVVFLAHKGKLLLFRSAEGLVEYVRSGAPHDLRDVEAFTAIADKLTPEHVVAAEDDVYELDLVVKNLRGGHDAWDPDILVPAGEIARDVAHACELDDTLAALATGSPLDDMDEALRNGGFWARRRLRRLGVEQMAIAWRGVIGKLSAAVEWHD